MDVFYWLFNMSIAAAITGVPVMLLRQIKRLPRRLSVFLWLIPFCRMVIPVGLASPYGLMSLISQVTGKTVVVFQSGEDVAFSAVNFTMAADQYFPITYKSTVLERVFTVATAIWLVAALAILLTLAVLYFTTLRELKDAKHLRRNIWLSDKITTPAVYGILRPRIILPAFYKDTELILLHEKAHIRRGDNLWRIAGFCTAAVHWFNPLSWVFLKLFLEDLELACDECVLAKLDDAQKKAYAMTLLACQEQTNVFASAFGGASVRTRIENILSFKKMTAFSFVVFLTLMTVIFYVLLTNAG